MIKNTIFRYVLLFFFPLLVSLNSYALDCTKIVFKVSNTSLKYCVGQEVNLQTEYTGDIDGGIVTYEWYEPNNTVPIPNQIGSSFKKTGITNSQEGVYKCIMKVTKGSDVCPKEVTFDVKVIDKFSFDLGADQTMCPGTSSIPLQPNVQSSNSAIVYSWTSAPAGITASSKDLTVSNTQISTQSTLTLTASFGNCVFSDNLKIANVSNFTMTAGADQSICKGGNANLSATVSNTNGFPVSYSWTGPGGFSSSSQNIAVSPTQESSIFTIKSKILNCELSINISVNVIEPILLSDEYEVIAGKEWLKMCTFPVGDISIKNGTNSVFNNKIESY